MTLSNPRLPAVTQTANISKPRTDSFSQRSADALVRMAESYSAGGGKQHGEEKRSGDQYMVHVHTDIVFAQL